VRIAGSREVARTINDSSISGCGSLRGRLIDNNDIALWRTLARESEQAARQTLTNPNYFAAASAPISVRSEQ